MGNLSLQSGALCFAQRFGLPLGPTIAYVSPLLQVLWPPVVESSPVWDKLASVLAKEDPYGREKSIHNGRALYNHSRSWVTHVSLQVYIAI